MLLESRGVDSVSNADVQLQIQVFPAIEQSLLKKVQDFFS